MMSNNSFNPPANPPVNPPEDGPDNPTTEVTNTPEVNTDVVNTLNANPTFVMPTDAPQVPVAEPEVPAGPTPEELAEIARQDALAKAAGLQETRAKLERDAQILIEEIALKEESAQKFAVWVEHHRRTFLWKMLSKMTEQLDQEKGS
jgi:hypothetical protein